MMRACRTDKGVHAAMQVVSVKLLLKKSDTDMIQELNGILPQDIRVFGVHRSVSNQFNARTSCDSRRYEYLLPTYILKGLEGNDPFWEKFRSAPSSSWETTEIPTNKRPMTTSESSNVPNKKQLKTEMTESPQDESIPALQGESIQGELTHPDSEDEDLEQGQSLSNRAPQLTSDQLEEYRAYRLSSDGLSRIQYILDHFVGTHAFHNYTIGKSIHEMNAKRFIKQFEVGAPQLIPQTDGHNMEWIRLSVHGQSFMLHQIRKFIGMLILLMKTGVDPSMTIPGTFEATKVNVPKAPGIGLLLAETLFTGMNHRLSDREPLSIHKYQDQIEAFKRDTLYPEIVQCEVQSRIFHAWWTGIQQHAYEFRYLEDNPQGLRH